MWMSFLQVYTSYQSEYHFLAFYTVLNCYVYLLAYMYAPTSAQVGSRDDSALKKKMCLCSLLLAVPCLYTYRPVKPRTTC